MATHSIINDKLIKEYSRYLANLRDLFNPELRKQMSLPLFMHVFPEYEKLESKVMVVGKETYGWYGNLAETEKLFAEKIVENYKTFELGRTYYNSPFWRFSKKLYRSLNPDKDLNGLLWTNLSKIDQNQTTPDYEHVENNFDGYKLLEREIELTRPDAVVFLTSWNQDELITRIFPRVEFQECKNIESRYLVKLSHDKLPENTYRTYHPRFLNSLTSKYSIDEIIERTVYEIKRKVIAE